MKKLLLLPALLIALSSFAQTGITWSAPVDVANSTFSNLHPRITLDRAGNPLILFGNSSQKKAYFTRWDGAAFTTATAINPASSTIFVASWAGPDIASKGDTVYVVYKKEPETSDTCHVFIRRSIDGGKIFSNPVRVDYINSDLSRFPTITTDKNGNPIVAFMRFNSSFGDVRWVVAKSIDGGNTFQPDVLAGKYSGGEACDCCPGSITSSDNYMTMLYRDNLNNIRDTWIGVSKDNGNTFPDGIAVDKQNWMLMMCPSSGPDGIIIGDTIYSVFMNGASGKNMVYSNKNSITTLNSSAGNLITSNTTGISQQNYPRIANSNKAVAQVWKQIKNSKIEVDMYFTTDIHKGFPMNYEAVATSNSNSIANADVAIANGVVHVVWQDDNSGTVKYRKGTYTPTTGIQENSTKSIFSVFPNPATEQLVISSLQNGTTNYTIYNALGQEVINGKLNNLESNIVEVSKWLSGVYYIKINTAKESFRSSFLVSHE